MPSRDVILARLDIGASAIRRVSAGAMIRRAEVARDQIAHDQTVHDEGSDQRSLF